jgi:ABC-2 type transport system permease protein
MNQTLRGFIRKELIQTLRDKRMRFFLFLAPIVQMTLFGVAISNEVKNLRLAAFFPPQDYIARDIYEHAISGGWFVPAKVSGSDPFQAIRADEADAVLVSPPGGLTKAIGRGNAPFQLLVDATNVTQAQAAESYLTAITLASVQEDLHLRPPVPPIRFDLRVLYNPSLETAIFMVPGVMCMLMVMTTMILCMTSITREKEMGTFEMLISAPVKPSEVIYGKTIPYVILGMCNLPLTLAVAVFLFGVPMRGSLLVLAAVTFVFVCTSVAMGTLISTICRNQQQANLGSILFMFPAIMFSGLIFPIENMPAAVKPLAYIDPLYHYLALLRNIMLKGGDLRFIGLHVLLLSVIAFFSVTISFRRFHTTLQ